MPSLEEWRVHLYGPRRDLQLRAARAVLAHGKSQISDLLFIFDEFALEGLLAELERVLVSRAASELVPAMRARLASGERYRRAAACTILGHCGDFSATGDLLAALRDPEMTVRRAAGFALACLKDPKALPALQSAAAAALVDDSNVQAAIRSAILQITPLARGPA